MEAIVTPASRLAGGIAEDPSEALTWMDDAACRGSDLALFFSSEEDCAVVAEVVCARCPVAEACLSYALEANIRYGLYGGVSERERRRMLRQRNGRDDSPVDHDCPTGYHEKPDRSCYCHGCRCSGCREQETAYHAARRQRMQAA